MTGLALSIMQWETTFSRRGPDGTQFDSASDSLTDNLVFCLSSIGCFAIFIKYYLESVWKDYKNPVEFYKALIQHQAESGIINPDLVTKGYTRQSNLLWILTNFNFWVEILIMMIVPLPFYVSDHIHSAGRVVYMESINWADNSGAYPGASHVYQTPFLVSDFYLAFMFFRFIFLSIAIA